MGMLSIPVACDRSLDITYHIVDDISRQEKYIAHPSSFLA